MDKKRIFISVDTQRLVEEAMKVLPVVVAANSIFASEYSEWMDLGGES